MRLTYALPFALLLTSTVHGQEMQHKESVKNERGFYSKEARGWLFYEDPEEKQEELPESPPPPSVGGGSGNGSTQEVKLDVEWLRQNMPRMLDDAQNNPTTENLAKYAFAQRLLLDMTSRFQKGMITFMEENPILDEDNRRPTQAMNLVAFKGEVAEHRKQIMEKLKNVAHIWFFYKSTCEYCHRQIPILKALDRRYSIETLAVTMDGIRIEGMDEFLHRADAGLHWTQTMNVTQTPTLMLMMNDGSGFTKLTDGLETLPSIEERLMKVALKMNVITQAEFDAAQDVIDINSLKQVDGTLVADKERLESDPNYFIELMTRQIELNNKQFGATRVDTGGDQ